MQLFLLAFAPQPSTFGFRLRRLGYGEPIAISVSWGGMKYLRYKEANVGIELTFAKTPAYEWVFTGGDAGKPVHTWIETKSGIRDVENGLYNKSRKAWLIQSPRPDGVGLRWSVRVEAERGGQSASQTCTVSVEVRGTYSKYADAVRVYEAASGKLGKFLEKHAFKTVRDHRQGRQGRASQQSRFTLSPGEYYIASAGFGKDKRGHFGVIFKPGNRRIHCEPGKTYRLLFAADFAEY
jgi:hypothetical protein